jgi:uncharacterized protein YndB with AHSA1/START domain
MPVPGKTASASVTSGVATTRAPPDGGHDLVIERTFNAPVAAVWRMWTTNEGLMQWGAPPPLRTVGGHADVRVGGTFEGPMVTPEGETYTPYGEYLEVAPMRRLVFTHAWRDNPAPPTTCTVELEPAGKGTRMRFRQSGFDSREERAGHEEGWTDCFGILAELVEA